MAESLMQFTDEDAVTAIGVAVGAASVCWEPKPAGVFDSRRASQIVDELVEHLRALRLVPDEPEPSCS